MASLKKMITEPTQCLTCYEMNLAKQCNYSSIHTQQYKVLLQFPVEVKYSKSPVFQHFHH